MRNISLKVQENDRLKMINLPWFKDPIDNPKIEYYPKSSITPNIAKQKIKDEITEKYQRCDKIGDIKEIYKNLINNINNSTIYLIY